MIKDLPKVVYSKLTSFFDPEKTFFFPRSAEYIAAKTSSIRRCLGKKYPLLPPRFFIFFSFFPSFISSPCQRYQFEDRSLGSRSLSLFLSLALFLSLSFSLSLSLSLSASLSLSISFSFSLSFSLCLSLSLSLSLSLQLPLSLSLSLS
jgi:hypothetical protein